jgi:hypothetical protein
VLIVLEVVVRVGAWAWHGWNEYYLFYGIHGLVGRLGVSPWSVYDGSHFKFPPNYTLQSAAGQGEETARTNSLGFRGPDFEPTKPADTYRVITLGGSSTFGFHNEDDATYPHHLQRLFDAGLAGGESEGPRFEVINSGFPYYTTASIRSLLESEVIDYDPDLITLYTAYNDASWPLSVNAALRGLFWVQQHSSIYLVLKETLLPDRRVYQLQNRMRRNLQATIDMGEIDADAEAIARRYRENLEAIVDLAEARGIRVLMIRQPMTTSTVNAGIDSLSYEQEFLAIREALPGQSYVNPMELRMIYHHRLLEEGDAIARERGLTVIDNVAITDEDRSGLTTWVHLTGEANHRLAQALHATIRDIARASVEDLPGEPNRDQGTAEDSR